MGKQIIFIALAACGTEKVPYGEPLFLASYIDNDLKKDVYTLAKETEAIVGYKIIDFHHKDNNAYTLGFNKDKIKEIAQKERGAVLGYCSYFFKEIWIAPPGETYSYSLSSEKEISITPHQKLIKVVLAHEIGHAMGLNHTGGGLMNETIWDSCIGHEAECLVNALIDAEKI